MSRAEKIKRLVELIEFVEGVEVDPSTFNNWDEGKINDELDFYDYVSNK
jgi:hypothetical protein